MSDWADAKPREEEQTPIPDSGPFEAFVGNLDFGVEERDLHQLFEGQAALTEVRLITDRETGRPKGFAYITFADRDALVTALGMNGVQLLGREVRIDVASQRGGGGGGSGGGGGGFGGAGGGFGRREVDDPNSYGSKGYRPVHADAFDYEKEPDADSLSRRPKLKLLKRGEGGPVAKPAAKPDTGAKKKKKSNPFGNARPREEILAERRNVDPSVIAREDAEADEMRSVGAVQAKEEAASAAFAAAAAVPQAEQVAQQKQQKQAAAKTDADADGFVAAGRGARAAAPRAPAEEEQPQVEAANPYDALEGDQ